MRASHPPVGINPTPWSGSDRTRERRDDHQPDPQPAPRPMGPNYPSTGLFLLPRGDDPCTEYVKIGIFNEDALEQGVSQSGGREYIEQEDGLGVLAFALGYDGDLAQWRITPLNQSARRLLPDQRTMTQQEWTTFVDSLRNLQLPGLSAQAGVAR